MKIMGNGLSGSWRAVLAMLHTDANLRSRGGALRLGVTDILRCRAAKMHFPGKKKPFRYKPTKYDKRKGQTPYQSVWRLFSDLAQARICDL